MRRAGPPERAHLQVVFPTAATLFAEIDSAITLSFLERFTTQEQADWLLEPKEGYANPYWEPALDPDGTRSGPARGTGARRNRRHPCTPGQSTEINSPSAGLVRRRRHPGEYRRESKGLAPVVLEL
jgi:hypothetical protein